MKTKYLTIRAELVETNERRCSNCIFGIPVFRYGVVCGLKFSSVNKKALEACQNGYYKNIEL